MTCKIALAVLTTLGLAAPALADLEPEISKTIPAITAKNRIYAADIAINHIGDGKLHIVDADSGRYLGMIGIGFAGQLALSNDKSEILVATGYLSRGQRGDRVDLIEVWDADTMNFKYEIPISDKRAMALQYEGLLRLSADGRWLFSQNATPATSVTVIDMKAKKMVGEIAMPGCWAIYPVQSDAKRFASLCGDGTIQTVTIDDSGKEAARKTSAKVFDADADAWFMQGEQVGDDYYFVSFKGNVVKVNVAGESASVAETWPLASKAEMQKGWRPGGYQPLAVHGDSNRLYVTMHPGGVEGSHKNPAKQIWAFDTKTHKRVARMPGHAAISLEPSPDGSRLYAIDIEKASIVIFDQIGAKSKVRTVQVGEIPIQLEAQ
jgi:methylamine dehydrogenase heavy chain